MSLFKSLPMDVVKYILPYDSRFVLRNGEIIQINKLDKYKTAALNLLLFKKPNVTYHFWKSPRVFWVWCDVRFSNGHRLFYSINKVHFNGHDKDNILYSYETISKCVIIRILT